MQFEKFTNYGRGYKAICSIRTNAQIGFNRGSIHRFELSDGHAVLFYSKEDRVIGIKIGVSEDEEGATRLIVKDNNAFISARSFLEYYNIRYAAETRQYETEWSDEHGMILVDLAKPVKRTRDRTKGAE